MKDISNLSSYIQLTISIGELDKLNIKEDDIVIYHKGKYIIEYIDSKTNVDILHLRKLND